MVTHVAPRRLYGVMMGTWFLVGSALAAAVSSMLAGIAEIPKHITNPDLILHIYSSAFTKIGALGVIAALVAFAINPHIKKAIRK